MYRSHRNIIVLLVLIASILSSPSLSGKEFVEGKLYRHELSNGLVVLTIERHIAPLIYHQLTYRVGGRHEYLGITGIAHYVEHMMFKGTPTYPQREALELIQKNGGIFNGFTAQDMTSYYEFMPSNKIEIALSIESDRMQNCIFDPDEFESEREVIRQERRMRSESSVQGIMRELLNSVAYSSHPYRDPVIGWPADLDNITREQAFEFYRTYYTPNNAYLVLVGAFQTREMIKLVEHYYGAIPRGPEITNIYAVDQLQIAQKTITLHHNDISSPLIQMAFKVPTLHSDDGPALRLAASILGARSRTSRLHRRLIEEERIATRTSAGMPASIDPPLFRISATVRRDSCYKRVEQMIWEEIQNMQNELVPEQELQKVKNSFIFSHITNYKKNSRIGSRMTSYEAYFGAEFIDILPERMQSVTVEDIQRVMRDYFHNKQATILYGLPGEDGGDGTVEIPEEEDEYELFNEVTSQSFDELTAEERFFYRTNAPFVTALYSDEQLMDYVVPNPIEPLVRHVELDNGIPLYTIESRLAPDLFIGGFFEVGMMPEADQDGQPGIVALLTGTMNRGTINKNFTELSERMAFVPFSFSIRGHYKSLYFQGYSLMKDADEMLETGFELLTQPAFRESDIDMLRSRMINSIRSRRRSTSQKAFYYMFDKIFEGHPYSTTESTEEAVRNISREDLVRFHEKYFNPDRLTIVMVGDLSHGEMHERANRYFGRWTSNEPHAEIYPIPPVEPFKAREIVVFNDEQYTEATINIGFTTFNDVDEFDEEVISILNQILAASSLTSRMGIELRQKRGLIYGIRSELWEPNDGIGYWKLNTKTAPENAREVLTILFSEVVKLLRDGIDDTELIAAKNRLLSLLPFYVETPDDVATQVFSMLRQNESLDTFDKKAERILSVTADDVMRVAHKYFTLDNFIVVIDGPVNDEIFDGLLDEIPESILGL